MTMQNDIMSELGLTAPETRPVERTMTGLIVEKSDDVAYVRLTDGRTATMPRNEWFEDIPWQIGWQIAVVLIDNESTNPVASAVRPEVVSGMYLGAVPELRDGRVKIMGVARAAGDRTKIAVASTTEEIDAVGAMLGRKANRVRLVSDRLRGERIDIIVWNADPKAAVANALQPATVEKVIIKGDRATAIVAPHQMSAAVGHNGINTLLASELTGYTIKIEAK